MKRMISLLLVTSLVSGCGKQLNKSQSELDKTYTQNDEQVNPSPSPSSSSSPTLRPTSTPKPTPTPIPIPNQEQKQDKIEQRDSEAFAELEESESKGWYETSLKYAVTAKDYAVAHWKPIVAIIVVTVLAAVGYKYDLYGIVADRIKKLTSKSQRIGTTEQQNNDERHGEEEQHKEDAQIPPKTQASKRGGIRKPLTKRQVRNVKKRNQDRMRLDGKYWLRVPYRRSIGLLI